MVNPHSPEVPTRRRSAAFRFETLTVWKQSRAFPESIYAVFARFTRHEAYGLSSQLHRAANAVCGVFLALDRGYLKEPDQIQLYETGQSLARQIQNLKATLT